MSTIDAQKTYEKFRSSMALSTTQLIEIRRFLDNNVVSDPFADAALREMYSEIKQLRRCVDELPIGA